MIKSNLELDATVLTKWSFEELDSCPACDGRVLEDFHRGVRRGLPLRFTTCVQCGHVFQNPRPDASTLAEYFSSSTFIADGASNESAIREPLGYVDYFAWDESYKKTAALRLERIAGFQPPPKNLLEIGTATGSFLDCARAFGYVVRGLDISATFAGVASRRHGLEIDVGWIEEFPLPANHYDVICMFGGISCWRDLSRGLQNVSQALKPSGIFVFNYSDCYSLVARLWRSKYPEINHASISLLHKQSVVTSLTKAGFQVALWEIERQIASIGRVVTYLKLGLLKRAAEFLRIQNLSLSVLAIGTIFVVARKQ